MFLGQMPRMRLQLKILFGINALSIPKKNWEKRPVGSGIPPGHQRVKKGDEVAKWRNKLAELKLLLSSNQ